MWSMYWNVLALCAIFHCRSNSSAALHCVSQIPLLVSHLLLLFTRPAHQCVTPWCYSNGLMKPYVDLPAIPRGWEALGTALLLFAMVDELGEHISIKSSQQHSKYSIIIAFVRILPKSIVHLYSQVQVLFLECPKMLFLHQVLGCTMMLFMCLHASQVM